MSILSGELDALAIDTHLDPLCRILVDSVADGASISFMAPMAVGDAMRFWRSEVMPEVAAGRRFLFCAQRGGSIVGTVQLVVATPPNQPHRCEIAKMIVHPDDRRLGIGESLLNHALTKAGAIGKTLVTLDTRTGDSGERLYARAGFEVAGIVPDFAWDSDGAGKHATTFMFRRL